MLPQGRLTGTTKKLRKRLLYKAYTGCLL